MESFSVLLVEDDDDCAEVIAEALRMCGHRVATARDPETIAFELARKLPDVVLVDGHLGAVDGIELVRSLRDGPLAGIPVLLATGRSKAEVAPAARAAGIERILTKPLDLALLFEAIAAAASRYRAACGPRCVGVGR